MAEPPAARRRGEAITLNPIEPFSTSIIISLWAALLLALPIILWQVWAFLAPAFQAHRQRSVIALVAFATLLGAAGMAFGYFIVLPKAIHFLTNYDKEFFEIQSRARDYYRFVCFVLVGVTVAFEVPVIVLGLVRLRIVSAARLRRTWRYGVFGMTVVGVILPGVDPVTTILTVIPLVALYALSIALATFFEPRWRGKTSNVPASES